MYDKIMIKTEIILLGNWWDPLIASINLIHDRKYELPLNFIEYKS